MPSTPLELHTPALPPSRSLLFAEDASRKAHQASRRNAELSRLHAAAAAAAASWLQGLPAQGGCRSAARLRGKEGPGDAAQQPGGGQ